MLSHFIRRSLPAGFALSFAGCAQQSPTSAAPIVLQGAMHMEIDRLLDSVHVTRTDTVGVWTFAFGTIDGYPVIVSRTAMGGTNSAAATALAIERYRPRAIINTGTAGGHDSTLHNGDIVIGTTAISLAAFRTPSRPVHGGSNSLEWIGLDLMERPGDGDGASHRGDITQIAADSALLAAAHRARDGFGGRVVDGVIGTSDVWNEELDRIARFHAQWHTSAEEMETAPAAQVARASHVPFIGIRVVSDNVLNGERFDGKTAAVAQSFVLRVVRAYITR